MIRRTAGALTITLLVSMGCATPMPSVVQTTMPAPSPIETPSSTAATVTIDAGGRYRCDSVTGCAAFVAIKPADAMVIDTLPEGWLPSEPYLLHETPIAGHGVEDVDGPTRSVDPIPPGTYLVTAGSLWVDDTVTTTHGPNAPNVFMGTGEYGPCQMPLQVDATTQRVSIRATFREDAWCELEVHAGAGVRLDVEMAGTIRCSMFPYACAAYLSVLPPGTTVDAAWRPAPYDPWWGTRTNGGERLDGAPVWTVPDLPVGRHRLLISLLGSSDVVSFTPDGQVAQDLLSRCYLDVDVTPETRRVGIVVTFTPGESQLGGTCRVDLAA